MLLCIFFFFCERPSVVVTKPITASGVSADEARRGCTGSGGGKAAAPACPPARHEATVTYAGGQTDG